MTPTPQTLEAALADHESAWRERGLLRQVYGDWHRELAARLAAVPGVTVELGSGIGQLKEVVPELLTSDVEQTAWADRVIDAENLPFDDGTVANVVLVDVFHHLVRPSAFLDEAQRVLAPGGRVVMLEPYCSPLSTIAYRWFHHEDLDFAGTGLDENTAIAAPLDANIARPTVAFFRNADEVGRLWPGLAIVERSLTSLFLYILTGGLSRRPLAPSASYRPLRAIERALSFLLPLAAFRCLIVLERRSTGPAAS
ncbi:MAG TPA: methyltransferase domain-containing protein [Gaiellaceae bacterium]|nr:methyltransferase domain-containing protein [Gaiellaceae bacterium]